jgi:hypothetical protein
MHNLQKKNSLLVSSVPEALFSIFLYFKLNELPFADNLLYVNELIICLFIIECMLLCLNKILVR